MGMLNPSASERRHATLTLWALLLLVNAALLLATSRTSLVEYWRFDTLWPMGMLLLALLGMTVAVSRADDPS